MFHSVIMSLSVHNSYVHIGVMQASELCQTPFSYHIIILLLKSTKIFTLGQEHGKPYAALFYFFAK